MAKASKIEWIAWILVTISAINVGLGTLGYDLIESVFGAATVWVSRIVGIAGLYSAYLLFTYCGKGKK